MMSLFMTMTSKESCPAIPNDQVIHRPQKFGLVVYLPTYSMEVPARKSGQNSFMNVF